MDFYQYYKFNRKEAEERASKLLKASRGSTLTESGFISHNLSGVSKDNIACLNLMHGYMLFTLASPEDLFKELNDNKISHASIRNKCFRTLAKHPYQKEWMSSADKETLMKMTNEEIFQKNMLFTLQELKEHGMNYIALSIANKKSMEELSKQSTRTFERLPK